MELRTALGLSWQGACVSYLISNYFREIEKFPPTLLKVGSNELRTGRLKGKNTEQEEEIQRGVIIH